jgi:hypothetical protein
MIKKITLLLATSAIIISASTDIRGPIEKSFDSINSISPITSESRIEKKLDLLLSIIIDEERISIQRSLIIDESINSTKKTITDKYLWLKNKISNESK